MILNSNSTPGSSLIGLPLRVHRFGVVAQAFDSVGDLDERAEAGQPQHLALEHIAHAMLFEEALPDIGLQLLHAQRQAAIVRLNGQNNRLDLVALLQHFGRMLDALGPAQVADVDQAVDAVFNLDERAEVGEVANLAFHHRSDRELLVQGLPRIRLKLLEAKLMRRSCGFTLSTTAST